MIMTVTVITYRQIVTFFFQNHPLLMAPTVTHHQHIAALPTPIPSAQVQHIPNQQLRSNRIRREPQRLLFCT